jgi:RNA polymerase sigma-70 factor (ECF subfamily)
MPVVAEREQLPVAEARAGDPAAWNVLFKRYQLPLYVFVFELLHNEQASLDVVQETFIRAVRHIRGLRDDARFSSWLFGIAHQQCVQHWRRSSREQESLGELAHTPEGVSEDPGEMLIRREQEEEFMRLLNRLPETQRAVLLLHYLEDFTLEEIADTVDAPIGTVKSRLHHARRALRSLMEKAAP